MQNTIKTENYKFILVQKQKKVQLTAIDNITLEMFQSDQIDLQQISPATIFAALKQQNKHIKYQLQRNETSIVMIIEVDFDFLPKIREEIKLTIIEKEESNLKIQIDEIKEQLYQLERSYKQTINTKVKIHQVDHLPAEFTLAEGTHLIEISGYVTRGYQQGYDEYGNLAGTKANLVYQIYQEKSEKQKKNIQQKAFPITLSNHESYEYPFKVAIHTKIQRKGKFSFKFDPFNYQIYGVLLTIITQ